MQRVCWNQSLSAELNRLILSKTSRYNTRMVAVSCPLLRDATTATEPIRLEASPWSRMRIAAGWSHTLCIRADGTIFAWGGNANGELGVGDREKRVVPAPVTGLLRNKSVVQVSAGLGHTACFSADGLLFTWGGQLGVGDDENRIVPTLVRALKGRQVVQVLPITNACLSRSTIQRYYPAPEHRETSGFFLWSKVLLDKGIARVLRSVEIPVS